MSGKGATFKEYVWLTVDGAVLLQNRSCCCVGQCHQIKTFGRILKSMTIVNFVSK